MKNKIVFETDRLIAREFNKDDVERIYEITQSKDKAGQPFNYYYFDGTKQSCENFISDALAGQTITTQLEARRFYMLGLEEKDTGRLIGHVTADYLPKDPDNPDLAYFIDPATQGRGYGAEAAEGMLNFVFDQLQAPLAVATAHPDNIASQKILIKMGFVEDESKASTIQCADGAVEPRKTFCLTSNQFFMMQTLKKLQKSRMSQVQCNQPSPNPRP